jgi:hypothetical protein
LDAYLEPGWVTGELLSETLKAQRKEADLQRERADIAESMLARATAQALDRLSEIGAERERAMAAEARIRELDHCAAAAEERAVAAERRTAEIETSTIWRFTAPIRRTIGARPRLRGALRRGLLRRQP